MGSSILASLSEAGGNERAHLVSERFPPHSPAARPVLCEYDLPDRQARHVPLFLVLLFRNGTLVSSIVTLITQQSVNHTVLNFFRGPHSVSLDFRLGLPQPLPAFAGVVTSPSGI
jgi:hypothetical protein